MVKGRRKGKTPSTRVMENTRKKPDSVEFNGKLSQTSPSAKITTFFESDKRMDITPRASPRNLTSTKQIEETTPKIYSTNLTPTISILQQANNIMKKSPHRIEISETPSEMKKLKLPRTTKNAPLNDTKSNKLTDYFPVRRSVRKTKKTVLEEKQKSIEEAVLSEREEGLEVHMFEGKGRGIISTKDFKRGDFVVEYAGELISLDDARGREAHYSQDQNTGCYMYYFMHRNAQHCVDATSESSRLGRLVNHSRNGNLMTKTMTVRGIPRLVLIAKEDIQSGVELSYDYGDRSKESLRHHPWLAS